MNPIRLPPLTPAQAAHAEKLAEALAAIPKESAQRILADALNDVAEKQVEDPIFPPEPGGTVTVNGAKLGEWIGADGQRHTVDSQVAHFVRTTATTPEEKKRARAVLEKVKDDLEARRAEIEAQRGLLGDAQEHLRDVLHATARSIRDWWRIPAPGSSRPRLPHSLAELREIAGDAFARSVARVAHDGAGPDFASDWYAHGFPTFELTGGLAAALAMTETAGLVGRDVHQPFCSWAIQMPSPSPLAIVTKAPDGKSYTSSEVRFLIVDRAAALAFGEEEKRPPGYEESVVVSEVAIPSFAEAEKLEPLLRGRPLLRFVVNLCVYIASLHALPAPEGRRKPGTGGPARKGEPPPPQRWVLGRAIKLSRGMVQAARLEAEALASPKHRAAFRLHARFMVRGHWRRQAYGKARAERRMKWIEPFWKGPEMADGLQRLYALGEASRT